MWIGNIEQLTGCKQISKNAIQTIIDFLKNHEMKFLPNGRYELGGENYVNIFEYDTRENDGVFETHQKYIDVQYPIEGKELVFYGKEYNVETQVYDEKKDCSLGKIQDASSAVLGDGKLCVFLVGEPHKAGVCVEDTVHVKKAVFKILG